MKKKWTDLDHKKADLKELINCVPLLLVIVVVWYFIYKFVKLLVIT